MKTLKIIALVLIGIVCLFYTDGTFLLTEIMLLSAK